MNNDRCIIIDNRDEEHLMKKSFTLIELLVVVAIIGILCSILLPSIQKARRDAMAAVCKSNQKQIGIGILSYAASNNDAFPYSLTVDAKDVPDSDTPPGNGRPTQEVIWYDAGESVDVFVCPLDPTPEDYNFWAFSNNKPHFEDENEKSSYMFNEKGAWAYARYNNTAVKFGMISDQDGWPMASDGRVTVSGGSNLWRRTNPIESDVWMQIDWTHNNNKVNMLFGDGHVESIVTFTSSKYNARVQ